MDRFRSMFYRRTLKAYLRDDEDSAWQVATVLGTVQAAATEERFLNQMNSIILDISKIGRHAFKSEFCDATQRIQICALLFLLSQFFRAGITSPGQLTLEYINRFMKLNAFGFTKDEMQKAIYELREKEIVCLEEGVLSISENWRNEIFVNNEA